MQTPVIFHPGTYGHFYAFCKSGGVSLPGASDQTADFLKKFFGSDKDKLKENLSRLLKMPSLSAKERREILKGIDVARDFFSYLNSPPALKIVDELELKSKRA